MLKKTVVGLTEKIKVNDKEAIARIDTGADKNSICLTLASKLKLNPTLKLMSIRSAQGRERRPIVWARLEIKGRKFKTRFNVADRRNMKYDVLIGKNILKRGFIIDPSRK